MAEELSAVATKASPRAVANASWSGSLIPVAHRVEHELERRIPAENPIDCSIRLFIMIVESKYLKERFVEAGSLPQACYFILFSPAPGTFVRQSISFREARQHWIV